MNFCCCLTWLEHTLTAYLDLKLWIKTKFWDKVHFLGLKQNFWTKYIFYDIPKAQDFYYVSFEMSFISFFQFFQDVSHKLFYAN